MATAEPRLAPWLFGGALTTGAALVVLFAVSTLTSALSAGLLVQLAYGGGEVPPKAIAAAVLIGVGTVFLLLGLHNLITFLS